MSSRNDARTKERLRKLRKKYGLGEYKGTKPHPNTLRGEYDRLTRVMGELDKIDSKDYANPNKPNSAAWTPAQGAIGGGTSSNPNIPGGSEISGAERTLREAGIAYRRQGPTGLEAQYGGNWRPVYGWR